MLGGIKFSECKWWVVLAQYFSSTSVFWGKLLAVSAPWGIEFNEKEFIAFQDLFEIFICEYNNTIFLFGGEGRCCKGNK
jgi:hypothetical protein